MAPTHGPANLDKIDSADGNVCQTTVRAAGLWPFAPERVYPLMSTDPEYRSRKEMEASFRPIETALDAAIEASRSSLEQADIEIVDSSNRSGWDMSGWGYHTWCHLFSLRATCGSYVGKATVEFRYAESLKRGQPASWSAICTSDVFQLGALSIFQHREDHPLPLDSIPPNDLARFLDPFLKQAIAFIPDHFRFQFPPIRI